MFDIGELRCADCERALTWRYLVRRPPWCLLCERTFCEQHFHVRDGVGNCAGCESQRRAVEEDGPISQEEFARIARLLLNDLRATRVPPEGELKVREAPARIRLFSSDAVDFERRVVDDVQQSLRDDFVDVS